MSECSALNEKNPLSMFNHNTYIYVCIHPFSCHGLANLSGGTLISTATMTCGEHMGNFIHEIVVLRWWVVVNTSVSYSVRTLPIPLTLTAITRE